MAVRLGGVERADGKDERRLDRAGRAGRMESAGGNSAMGEMDGVEYEMEDDRRCFLWLWEHVGEVMGEHGEVDWGDEEATDDVVEVDWEMLSRRF